MAFKILKANFKEENLNILHRFNCFIFITFENSLN